MPNENVPFDVGVPLSVPVEFSESPGGNVLEADHEYGVVPPEAVSVAEYGCPAMAPGRAVDVQASFEVPDATVSSIFAETVCSGLELSVRSTTKL